MLRTFALDLIGVPMGLRASACVLDALKVEASARNAHGSARHGTLKYSLPSFHDFFPLSLCSVAVGTRTALLLRARGALRFFSVRC